MAKNPSGHIRLTSHPSGGKPHRYPIDWGASSAAARGAVIGSTTARDHRNVIGAHGGAYSIYRALAVSSGTLDPNARPDLKDTGPLIEIGPHRQWMGRDTIVSLDPWGHRVAADFGADIENGLDVRPTIAITKARLMLPEVRDAVEMGRLSEDGAVVRAGGEVGVIKAAIDPVWHLPGVARRFSVTETLLRRTLFEQTAGMYPELVTRRDLHVFLPPIGGTTLYIFGDPAAIGDPQRRLTCRIHDECNGSDVFGSDICTCRPYLTHGVEECIRAAQAGGVGLIVYNRKEGRALGEVTKFLVYNARKRQPGGDQAATYFARTECVAGVQDARFQQLMPDAIHWLGVTRIDRLVSMSNLKYDALIGAGIEIGERVALPPELVPQDAMVEIAAKKAAGYFTAEPEMPAEGESPACVVGRDIKEY
ncbi:MAG: GTP cyclohydrolase II [Steroidobacteraceae bacterium]